MPLLLMKADRSAPKAGAAGTGADKPAAGPAKWKHGDRVRFRHGDVEGEGAIVASGPDGVTVKGEDGREHRVRHEHLCDDDNAKSGEAKDGKAKKDAPMKKSLGAPLLLFAKARPMRRQPSRPWPLIPPPDAGKGGAPAKADAAPATPAPDPPDARETGPDAGTVTGRALYFWRAMHAVRNLVPARRKG